jgi:hypothetical protein
VKNNFLIAHRSSKPTLKMGYFRTSLFAGFLLGLPAILSAVRTVPSEEAQCPADRAVGEPVCAQVAHPADVGENL